MIFPNVTKVIQNIPFWLSKLQIAKETLLKNKNTNRPWQQNHEVMMAYSRF